MSRRAGGDKSDPPFKFIGDSEDDHLIAGEVYARTLSETSYSKCSIKDLKAVGYS